MKIGNIIYKDELVNHTKQPNINYLNIVDDIHEFDQTLPTLFVGWRFFKENFESIREKYGVDILDKTINTNQMYWEFSFDEDKSDHVNGINDFIISLPQLFFKMKYTFISLDFIQERDSDVIDIINKGIDSTYMFKDRYIYLLTGNIVYGINLEHLRFLKDNDYVNIIIDLAKENSKKFYHDSDGECFKEKLNDFHQHNYLYRYMPIVLSS